jgi:glutamate-1-semialdehyde 2,1-aminomutase
MGSIAETPSERLHAALHQAHDIYRKRNPKSLANNEEASKYMPGGNTRTVLYTTPFPMTIDYGNDCHLTSLDGDEYIDFLGEYTAGIYGHNHPAIKQAIQSALENGWNYGAHNKMERQLAQTVCERFPALEMVRFVNSGTEANMMALATALVVTRKRKVLLFNKGYHGSTISGRAASGKPSINLPHDFVVGTYNDVEGTEELVNGLPGDSLAAILVEPMLGSGGAIPAKVAFLETLRRLADQHKALLIFDEVMTSRLDYHGLGHTTGIKPDMMTLGKYIGGGMSFGAFGGRRDIMDMFNPKTGNLEHPGTFNNNTFTMTAGIAGCSLLTREKVDALNALGDKMRKQIEDVLAQSGITQDYKVPTSPPTEEMHDRDHPKCPPKMFITGVGSLMCIQFAGPDRDALTGLFFHHMLQKGIYLAQRGFIALNIMLTEEHVKLFVATTREFVDQWSDVLKW